VVAGGGADVDALLSLPRRWAIHFHSTLKGACDGINPPLPGVSRPGVRDTFLRRHRGENLRGVVFGGIFCRLTRTLQGILTRVRIPSLRAGSSLRRCRAARPRAGAVVPVWPAACGYVSAELRADRREAQPLAYGERERSSSSTPRPLCGIQSRLRCGHDLSVCRPTGGPSRFLSRLPASVRGVRLHAGAKQREALLTDLFTCPQDCCRRITEGIAAKPHQAVGLSRGLNGPGCQPAPASIAQPPAGQSASRAEFAAARVAQ